MKFLDAKLRAIEAHSTMLDLAYVFLKTIDGLYTMFWIVTFWILGLLAIFMPSLNIQKFASISLLFTVPIILTGYFIWHRLGSSMMKKADLAVSIFSTSIWAVVPFYKFLIG